ncbi:MAG TPA: hypothetical protein VKX16_17735 [Chloroflexota bacterium]|nr:hypothetical protein [Chloroflexota bacterium]
MRCGRRLIGAQVAFVVLGLEGEARGAAQELGWSEVGDGIGVVFPATTRFLDRAYANFERYAPAMLRQLTGAGGLPWQPALSRTMAALEPLDIHWYLVGSGALAVRGIPVTPRDIDLVTDIHGARVLEDALQQWLVQPLVASPGWIADSFTRAFLGVRVEWAGGVHADVDGEEPSDFGPLPHPG